MKMDLKVLENGGRWFDYASALKAEPVRVIVLAGRR